jgi:hypothetical protein
MRNCFLAFSVWVTLAAALLETGAYAGTPAHWNRVARRRASTLSWHDRYYHTAYGTPVALVVPPTAEYQTDWSWGVGGTRITPIYHQFGRRYPGGGGGGGGFNPTPLWPSDTNQFGVHYIRGPW